MDNSSDLLAISNYLNVALESHPSTVNILPTDSSNVLEKLSDGLLLCYLINTLSKKGTIIDEGTLRIQRPTLFHKLDHCNKALEGAKKIGLQIVNIQAQGIVDMKQSVVIGLMNQILKQCPKQKLEKKPEPKQEVPYIPPPPHKEEEPTFNQQKQEPPSQQPVLPPQIQDPQAKIQAIRAIPINSNLQPLHPQAETGFQIQNAIGLQVLVLTGSLRQTSINKGIVMALKSIKTQQFFENMHFHTLDLSLLPLFNHDLEDQNKAPKFKIVQDLRSICRRCNGVLIATPEYNGSVSPVIKNAFDWLSRTYDDDFTPLNNKKVGVVSTSYLTEQQINDVKIMGQHSNINLMENHYYISLKKGASDMETGQMKNVQEKERLAMWYQEFSHFVMSGKDHPAPIPRFLLK